MSENNTLDNFKYLLDRIGEPLFIAKDDVTFDVPADYWTERYKTIAPSIQTRFPSAGTVIPIQDVKIPDISQALSLERNARFSIFNPYHRSCAIKLIEIFMGMPNVDQFLSACVYTRERVNPYMFVYAMSVALLHRPDTKNVTLPTHVETFPELYMDGSVFNKAREEATVVPTGSRIPIEIPRDYTATDLDIEHRIAYWREDVGLNLMHWHWHLVYPFDGPLEIVRKDRRGELFYYMHQQILSRYNFERLCNNLPRTRRLTYLRDPIAEGYFPKLDSLVASRNWPARQPNSTLSDLNREADQIRVDLQDLERWRDRIYDAIHSGTINNGQRDVPLGEVDGIDVLGNIIESSIIGVNRNRYGDLHNMGHLLIAYVHDPNNSHLETFGVMGDPTTAMRDPLFYPWHAFIDDIFQEFKATLPGYTTQQLGFENVRLTGVEVINDGLRNEFSTFWQQNDIELSRGLDFTPRGSVYARVTHLQHSPFLFKIRVENSGVQRPGTVRIFLAPKLDERGLPFLFRDQRGLFIELDKFTVILKNGTNDFERRPSESSVTIPFEQTFRDLSNRPTSGTSLENFNYCGCGWPQHLLIPRGNAEGFQCELFVMVSDGKNDIVQQNVSNVRICDDAQSYCGLRGGKYPDLRAMGYPFDRLPRAGVNTLRQFITPNMFIQDVRIRFTNRVTAPSSTRAGTRGQTPGQRQPPGQRKGMGSSPKDHRDQSSKPIWS